jgi:class 3 adenylate cyclase
VAVAVRAHEPTSRTTRLVAGADGLLAAYAAASTVIAVVAWRREEASGWPATWIGLLLVTNVALSALPARRRHPVAVEAVRAAAGALLAPAAYLTSARPFGHWWPGFVLMALVGSFGVALLSTTPRIARAFSVYYVTLFVVSAFLADDVTLTRGWVVGGGIAIATAAAAELIARLGDQLTIERTQRAQIEELMHRVFPVSVAESLGRSGRVAEQYAEASILFADIVGFSPVVATMAPGDLLSLLDEVFSALDGIVDELGLEKIKTIGDCYMVASGVPDPRADHAAPLCEFALRAVDLVRAHRFGDRPLQLRIGINSGPVVAGVVGQKRFLFDLWGDAVNVASRMESHGTPGTIQITDATHDLVADRFECVDRGEIDVKGKGPMRVWHVVGRRGGSPRADSEIDLRASSKPATPGWSAHS